MPAPAPLRTNRRLARISRLAVAISLPVALVVPGVGAAAGGRSDEPEVSELVSFVDGPCADDICGSGSAIGPDGALYVTDSTDGEIQRIDLRRGTVRTYADGLPLQIPGVIGGGVADIAFLGRTAYVLVTGVSEFWTELVGSTNARRPRASTGSTASAAAALVRP